MYALLCLFLVACSNTQTTDKINLGRIQKTKTKITLDQSSDLTDSQRNKYSKALLSAELILNSQEFKEKILNGPQTLHYLTDESEYQTKNCVGKKRSTYSYNVVDNKCYSNDEIYKIIKAADWKLKVKVSPTWWAIRCEKPWIYAVGSLEGDTIVTPECKFKTMSSEFLASFLIHEYIHVIGFRHPYNPSKNRKYTVPYFVSDTTIEMLAKTRKNR